MDLPRVPVAQPLGFFVTRVYVEHVGRELLLHEPNDVVKAVCWLPMATLPVDFDRLVVHEGQSLRWCQMCWPTHRRCVVCHAPAGDDVECGPCTKAWLDADTAHRRFVA
jgi:hypothetical protein